MLGEVIYPQLKIHFTGCKLMNFAFFFLRNASQRHVFRTITCIYFIVTFFQIPVAAEVLIIINHNHKHTHPGLVPALFLAAKETCTTQEIPSSNPTLAQDPPASVGSLTWNCLTAGLRHLLAAISSTFMIWIE